MVSFPKRYQYHQIGTPLPSGQSRHHRLPLVFYPTYSLRGFFTSPTSHSDSFHSFILWAGSSSPYLLSHFRFGQTRSETKTLQIVLESSCFHFLLTIWYSGLTALVSFPFDKDGSGVWANCSVALRPFFLFRLAQYAQVFLLKPAPFCKFFAGLGSTNKSAIFLLFYLTSLCPLLHFSFYLNLSGRSCRNCLLSPVLAIRLQ